MMTKEELELINSIIDSEGMEYAFLSYSDFLEIKDETFHSFRRSFCEASYDLADYLIDEASRNS